MEDENFIIGKFNVLKITVNRAVKAIISFHAHYGDHNSPLKAKTEVILAT